jgi:hypothetical protein
MTTLLTILLVILVIAVVSIAVTLWGILKALQSLVFVAEKVVSLVVSTVNRFKGFGK